MSVCLKMGNNTSAKNIDPGQPREFLRTDLSGNILRLNFLFVKEQFDE